jgi:hypothetical protein
VIEIDAKTMKGMALLARALGEAKDLKLGMKIRHDIARISGIMPKQDAEVVSTKKATK